MADEYLTTKYGPIERSIVHTYGYKHHTVHCLFYDERLVMFQRRAKTKTNFPDMLDTTVGGHILQDEPPLEALHRETKEEIGVDLSRYDPVYLGLVCERLLPNDNEVAHLYAVYTPIIDLYHTVSLTDEVSGYHVYTKRQFIRLLAMQPPQFVPHKRNYWRKFLKHIMKEVTL